MATKQAPIVNDINQITDIAQLRAMLAQAEADKQAAEARAAAAEQAKHAGVLTVKPSPHGTGTLCVYGLGRFPTTLRAEQWLRLFAPDAVKAITGYIMAQQALPVAQRELAFRGDGRTWAESTTGKKKPAPVAAHTPAAAAAPAPPSGIRIG